MKNNTETKRIALCVHAEEEYISKIYSWKLPDTIRDIEVGTILEVENFNDTADVVFIAEQTVTDNIERKSALKVASWKLRDDCRWERETLHEVMKIKATLDSGEYSHEEYTGFDLELGDGGFKKSKRVAYCARVDKNSISNLFPVFIPDHFNDLEPGTPVYIENVYGECFRNVIFVFEREESLSFKTEYKVISHRSYRRHRRSIIQEDVKESIRAIAKDLENEKHQPIEFQGFDIVLGWNDWGQRPLKKMTKEEYRKDLALRQESIYQEEKKNGSTKYRVKKISPEEILPYRLYIEVDAESGQYKTSEKYPLWYAKYFFLVHNCKGEIGECIRGDAKIIETEFGFLCDIPFGNGKIPKEICLRNPVKIDGFKKDSLFFEFIEDEEKFLDGFVHNQITLLSETEKSFTLSDGTKCRFVPALENMKVFPWMAPDDDRVIHQLKYKNTKWLCESQLDEARRHLADDGQVYILEVLQEVAGKFFWDTVIQTTYCHRYCTPRIFNATSSKKEAFEEVARFATAYVSQNGVNQYQDIDLYQEFWYSPGNYSDYYI